MLIKRKILSAIKRAILIIHVIFFERLKTKKLSYKEKSVALIRLDAIGDFVLWAGTAKYFRERYTNYKITLFVNDRVSSLATMLPYWDEVVSINPERLKLDLAYRRKILSEIGLRSFSLAIQPTYSRDIFTGDSIIRVIQTEERVGVKGDAHNTLPILKKLSDSWYTKLIDIPNLASFELERNYQFLSNFFQTRIDSKICHLPSMPLREELKKKIGDKQYIIIFPGAGNSIRHWPEKKYQIFIREILKQQLPDMLIVLCGGIDEFDLCANIQSKQIDQIINFAGETTLVDFVALLRSAYLLISNETSSIHIAAAVSTPVICIAGGGHYGRFVRYPSYLVPEEKFITLTHQMPCFGCNWQCTQQLHPSGAAPCVANVEVMEVIHAFEQLAKTIDRSSSPAFKPHNQLSS